jgi:hypothetical protein
MALKWCLGRILATQRSCHILFWLFVLLRTTNLAVFMYWALLHAHRWFRARARPAEVRQCRHRPSRRVAQPAAQQRAGTRSRRPRQRTCYYVFPSHQRAGTCVLALAVPVWPSEALLPCSSGASHAATPRRLCTACAGTWLADAVVASFPWRGEALELLCGLGARPGWATTGPSCRQRRTWRGTWMASCELSGA